MSNSRHIKPEYANIIMDILGIDISDRSVDKSGYISVTLTDDEYKAFKEIRDNKTSDSETKECSTREQKIVEQILQRYSLDELKMLANGRGVDKDIKFKEFVMVGEYHKFGVLSDTHIGSHFTNDKGLVRIIKQMEDEGCEFILLVGDITEGLKKSHPGWEYSQKWVGFDAQKEKAIEIFSQTKLNIYAVNGNHDLFFFESNGANMGKSIGIECKNFHYLGNHKAVIRIGGVPVMMFHGNDGSPKTKSYRQQDIANNLLATEEEPPKVLFLGHVHKYCVTPQSGMITISCPSIESLTDWMQGKRLVADCGGLICEMETNNGEVVNFSQKWLRMPSLVEQTKIIEYLNK